MFFTGQYALSTPMFQRIIPIIFLRLAEKASKKEEKSKWKTTEEKSNNKYNKWTVKHLRFVCRPIYFWNWVFQIIELPNMCTSNIVCLIFFPLSLFLSFFYWQSKRTAKLRSYRREYIQNVYVTLQVLDKSACVIADKRPTL